MIKHILIGIVLLFPNLCISQKDKIFESKLLETDRLNIEYMDFGGDGVPLIVVQGAHNYFDKTSKNPYINHENNSWISFYAEFAKCYHVLAPLKRGFGKTDLQLKEESVKTSTLDLISFMDGMGFEKAFFIGRDIAAQTMLDLAETNQNRIAGLIFLDPRFVFTNVEDKAAKDFIFYSYLDSYNASEYKNYSMKESEFYRPRIFNDGSKRIDIPTLLFYHSFFSSTTLESRRIERFIQWVNNEEKIEWNKEYNSIEIAKYFQDLSKDKERMIGIRNYLLNNDPTPKMYDSLKLAFGDNLIVFNETNMQVEDVKKALLNVYAPVVKAFLFMSN